MEEHKNKHESKDYFNLGEMFGYFFRKKDSSRKTDFNLKMMHGINKISILVFLAGMIYLMLKFFFLN